MKNSKGFTLVELLAMLVVLGKTPDPIVVGTCNAKQVTYLRL